MLKIHFGVVVAAIAFSLAACTQTQVADTAKGAGSVLVGTIMTAALDVAFDTNSSTQNLSDEELAQCRPRGDCLALSARKEQETDAFIARNRRAYSFLVESAEPIPANSLADWMNAERPYDEFSEESTSIMLRQPPLQVLVKKLNDPPLVDFTSGVDRDGL